MVLRRGKPHAVRELVLEINVGGEAHVLDRRQRAFPRGDQEHFCPSERSVAGRVNPIAVRFHQANAECAFNLHIVAEGTSEMDALEIAGGGAEALQEQLESRCYSALCQLQFANVGLVKDDGAGNGEEFRAVGDPSRRKNSRCAKADGDGVNKSAAADAAWLDVANDICMYLFATERHVGNGTSGDAHAHPNASSFKSGPCGGRGANDAEAVTDSDFAVGSEVDQGHEMVTMRNAGSENSGEDVRANKPSQTGCKTNCAGCWQMPAEILRAECLTSGIW